MNTTYIIDGSNVCYWDERRKDSDCSILPLLSIILALLENGDDFLCVFDANIGHLLKKNGRADEALILFEMRRLHRSRFYFVKSQTQADRTVITEAIQYNSKIITNDRFNKPEDKCDWQEDERLARLCRGQVTPSGIILIEKLIYGEIELLLDAKDIVRKISDRLSSKDGLGVNNTEENNEAITLRKAREAKNTKKENIKQSEKLSHVKIRKSDTSKFVLAGIAALGTLGLVSAYFLEMGRMKKRDAETMVNIDRIYAARDASRGQ